MHSKRILNRNEKIKILLDSNSFDVLINEGVDKAKLILEYSYKDPFIFHRSPKKTAHDELKKIPELILEYDKGSNIKCIHYKAKDGNGRMFFGKKTKDIVEYAEYILRRSELEDSEIELMKMIFILADFTIVDREASYILITTDKNFLDNRIKINSDFTFSEVNIIDIDEAIEIMSLYSRYQNLYYVRHNYTVNKGLWYDYAFRKYIPIYNFKDVNLRSFSIRFNYLLMSLDEMGYQYYLGVNNDIHENIMFYFNYFILLITGIFDSLALMVNDKCSIGFNVGKEPWKISLRREDFLKKVKEKNSELYQHIEGFLNYINLIHEIRNFVVHREMFHEQFTIRGKNSGFGWEGSFLKLNIEIYNLFIKLNSENIVFEDINEWGLFEKLIDLKCVDMYIFAKRALKEIIIFSKKYLSLLDCFNVKAKGVPKRISSSVEIFDKHALCYY